MMVVLKRSTGLQIIGAVRASIYVPIARIALVVAVIVAQVLPHAVPDIALGGTGLVAFQSSFVECF